MYPTFSEAIQKLCVRQVQNRSSRYIHVLFYDISNALLWIILSYYLSWTANKWLNWIMEVVVDIKRRHAEQENSSSVHFYSLIMFIITFFQTVLTQTLRENGFWKSCRKLKVPMKSKLSPWNESFLGVSINMLVLRLSISQCAPKQWQNSHLGDISIQSWQFVTSAKWIKVFFDITSYFSFSSNFLTNQMLSRIRSARHLHYK